MRDLFARCAAPPQPRVGEVFFLDESEPESRPDTEDAGIIR